MAYRCSVFVLLGLFSSHAWAQAPVSDADSGDDVSSEEGETESTSQDAGTPAGVGPGEPAAEPSSEATDTPEPSATTEPVASAPEQSLPSPPPAASTPVPTTPRSPMIRWRVRSGVNRAIGFPHPAGEGLLVTSASVWRHRGSVSVEHPETGESYSAEVVRLDSPRGLLLLLVADAELGASPPVAVLRVGERVHSEENGPRALVLSGGGEDDLSYEVNRVCSTGAPVLSESGELVGICRSGSRVVPSQSIVALVEPSEDGLPIGDDSPGRWRLRVGIDGRYRILDGFDNVFGFGLGVGVVGYDILAFAIRFGIMQEAQADVGQVALSVPGEVAAEVQLHAAFRVFGAPIRLVLGLGAIFRVIQTTTTESFLTVEDGCDPSNDRCPVVIEEEATEVSRNRFLPNVRAEINLGALAFSYEFALDFDDLRATSHTLGLGLVF